MLEVRTNPSSSSDTGMTVEHRTHGPRPEPLQCGRQCELAVAWNGVCSPVPTVLGTSSLRKAGETLRGPQDTGSRPDPGPPSTCQHHPHWCPRLHAGSCSPPVLQPCPRARGRFSEQMALSFLALPHHFLPNLSGSFPSFRVCDPLAFPAFL